MERNKGTCWACGEDMELKPFGDVLLCLHCLEDVEKNWREDLRKEIHEIAETFSLKETL